MVAHKLLIVALRAILPVLVLIIIFSIVVYSMYYAVGSAVQKGEHQAHLREEQGAKSIEVAEAESKKLGNILNSQLFTFQLAETQSYRIYNLKISYDYYNPVNDIIVVSTYCDEKPLESWTFQPFDNGNGVNYNIECKDWDGTFKYSILIVPRKMIMTYMKADSNKQIVITTYLLDFQVKVIPPQKQKSG